VKLSTFEGRRKRTITLYAENLSAGCDIHATEFKVQESAGAWKFLLLHDMMPSSTGDISRRPGVTKEDLLDPVTHSKITEDVISVIPYRKHGQAAGKTLIATPSRLFYYQRNTDYPDGASPQNMLEIFDEDDNNAFPNQAQLVDWEVFNDKLYIATGRDALIEWDGVNPLRRISLERTVENEERDGWPENLQYPSLVCRHLDRLFVSGFHDVSASIISSELHYTPMDSVDSLEEDAFLFRSLDNETPTALISSPWGLVVCKSSSAYILTGDLVSPVRMSMRTLSKTRGCLGPKASMWADNGLHVLDKLGPYLITGASSADVDTNMGRPVSPVFGAKTNTDVQFPHFITKDQQHSFLVYDPHNYRMFYFFPSDRGSGNAPERRSPWS